MKTALLKFSELALSRELLKSIVGGIEEEGGTCSGTYNNMKLCEKSCPSYCMCSQPSSMSDKTDCIK
jgi:hypothetical protein